MAQRPSVASALDARPSLSLVPRDEHMAALEALERKINAAMDPPPTVRRHDGLLAPNLTFYRYAMETGDSLAAHIPTAACFGDVPTLVGLLAAAVERNLKLAAAAQASRPAPERE